MRRCVVATHFAFASIPAPTPRDEPFLIRDILTVYEAAMVYAGRHPYPHFFSIKNGSIDDHLEYLKLGIERGPPKKRARARRSWDAFCEIMTRIAREKIEPVKLAYDTAGNIDPCRTFIKKSELLKLSSDRQEAPKYLRRTTVAGPLRNQIDAQYQRRIKGFLEKDRRYPTREEDTKWGRELNLTRTRIRELRNTAIPAEIRKGGRPKTKKAGQK
jgi:hypothetical protein